MDFQAADRWTSSLGGWPLELVLPPALLALFVTVYSLSAPKFATEKQKAYILSALSSGTMTLVSLPFVGQYLWTGLGGTYELAQDGWRRDLGRFGVLFFATYLFVADLAIGYLKYPSQVGMLTGWIHHTVYIALMIYLLRTRLSPIFLIAAIMELPTFDLAISHLWPQARSDTRFLSTFFIIRIAFHLAYLVDSLRPSSRAITDGSWVPAIMLSLALVLHVSWFQGGLTGYFKRRRGALRKKGVRAVQEEVEAEKHEEDEMTVLVSTHGVRGLESTPSGPLSRLGSTSSGGLLSPSTPTILTPDDSPLVTPYTPSQTPLTLRDSYIFNVSVTLPNITIPTLPNLPLVSIPSIPSLSDFAAALPPMPSRPDLNFGFKDAVKTRWEEQRGRFAGMGMGSAGAMTVLRRRAGSKGEADAGVRGGQDDSTAAKER